MGTKVAPSYANLFMADFEETYVYTYRQKPLLYKRFIDDIFMIWTHGREALTEFITYLNSRLPTIKFTTVISDTHVSFLDTSVKVSTQGVLTTDLYCKPTDSHNYLLYSSSHTLSCKRGIPYGQFLRVRRICSQIEDYDKHALTLAYHFTRRGYPRDLIENAMIKARRQDRVSLLSTANITLEDNQQPFYFITTYQPGFSGPSEIIKNNWAYLARHSVTQPLYETRVVFGKRRPQNLRDILVRAKLPQTTDPSRDTTGTPTNVPTTQRTCTRRSCRYCPKLNHSGSITSHATGRKYYAKQNVNCKTNNLIYCINCTHCGLQYIGQTKRTLMERFQGHFYNINNNKREDTIGRHFNSQGHHGIQDIEIYILDFIHITPDSEAALQERLRKESDWIHRLRTPAPWGLNYMD